MFVITIEIDDGSLETSPEEWDDNPRCIASAHEVISVKTLVDFFERDIALKEDYYLTPGKE